MKLNKIVFPMVAMLLIGLMSGCDKNDDPQGELPQVTSTDPINEAVDIDISTVISANFSVAMDPTTINTSTFMLKLGPTNVTGIVSYSGTTAVFTPTNPLILDTDYTALITSGAQNTEGRPLAGNIEWGFRTFSPGSGPEAVNLNASENYVILAKTAITNNPTSTITGDLGLSPAATSYITGFSLTDETGYATSAQVVGRFYAADMADPTPTNLTTAVENMITAYNDAAGRPSPHFIELETGNIGGKTLLAGLYKWTNTVTLTSDVTISGNATDVWIFQIAQDLILSNDVNLTLTGGALAKNVFWQVAGTVTLRSDSHFEGIILSMTGITFENGASFKGRALAQTAVVLDNNAITMPE
ncbi:MAG: ice-binding family protein [Bacteroidales bacterium]